MGNESASQNDGLLAHWLQTLLTRGEEAAESALALLIETHIEPVIRSVIRFKLRLAPRAPAHQAALAHHHLARGALAQCRADVRKLGAEHDSRSTSDARGLAATITYRVCYGWLRRRSPRRHALRNRLQYLLTRQAGLALWPAGGQSGQSEKALIAGFASWRGPARASAETLRQLPGDEKFLARASRLIARGQDAKLNDLLAAIFDYVGGPVAFDELVGAVAALLRIKDEPPASTEEGPEAYGAQLASCED